MGEVAAVCASFIWGMVGIACLWYGHKQREIAAVAGGLSLIALGYFVPNALVMSVLAILVLIGTVRLVLIET